MVLRIRTAEETTWKGGDLLGSWITGGLFCFEICSQISRPNSDVSSGEPLQHRLRFLRKCKEAEGCLFERFEGELVDSLGFKRRARMVQIMEQRDEKLQVVELVLLDVV